MHKHFTTAVAALGAAALAASATSSASAQNVAFGKPVSLVTGSVEGEALSTLVDDVFLERGTLWQSGTVWWQGLDTLIEIDLQGTFLIESLVAQVDDNDAYDVLYRVPATGAWELLWAVPNYNEMGSGMQTRPDPANSGQRYFLPVAVETSGLRLRANNGDSSYSASELQAWIVPGPGGASVALAAGMAAARRRRR